MVIIWWYAGETNFFTKGFDAILFCWHKHINRGGSYDQKWCAYPRVGVTKSITTTRRFPLLWHLCDQTGAKLSNTPYFQQYLYIPKIEQNRIQKGGHHTEPCFSTVINCSCGPSTHSQQFCALNSTFPTEMFLKSLVS